MSPPSSLRGLSFVQELKSGPAAQILLLLLRSPSPLRSGDYHTASFAVVNPHRPFGTGELCRALDWSDKSVTCALRALQDQGLVQRVGRYQGWLVAPAAESLLDGYRHVWAGPKPASPPGPKPNGVRLQPESNPVRFGGQGEPGTVPARPGRTWPPACLPWRVGQGDPLYSVLVEQCESTRDVARKAVASIAAAASGTDDDTVETWCRHALMWLSYCRSKQGQGINTPGLFIPSRLTRGDFCPPGHKPDYDTDLGREIDALAGITPTQRIALRFGACPHCFNVPCTCHTDPDDEDDDSAEPPGEGGRGDETPAEPPYARLDALSRELGIEL